MTAQPALQPLFEDHPVLGAYLSHHPSRREVLLLRGALLYAFPVLILQLLFQNEESALASVFLPVTFAAVALGVFWYIAHLWNREIILYQHGFTYREGSSLGQFRYDEIVKVRQRIEEIAWFGIFRHTRYDYTLITAQDEKLRVTNLYSDIAKLTAGLDAFIARDRLPLLRSQMESGTALWFGDALKLSRNGLEKDSAELFWNELTTYRVQAGKLLLYTGEKLWAELPVTELDNPVLLIAMLKSWTRQTPSA